jgi:hypothetical protein
MQDTGERPVCPWLLSEIPATLPASVRCNLIGAREEGVGVLRATLRVRVRAR